MNLQSPLNSLPLHHHHHLHHPHHQQQLQSQPQDPQQPNVLNIAQVSNVLPQVVPSLVPTPGHANASLAPDVNVSSQPSPRSVPPVPQSLNFHEVASEISSLNLICLAMGDDFILVHRPKFDVILEGEPFQTLQLIVHLHNRKYLIRVWGETQTHLDGTVDSVKDLRTLCQKFFGDAQVCVGLPRRLDKSVRVISYPVARYLSRDCQKIVFGSSTRCSPCAECLSEFERKAKLEPPDQEEEIGQHFPEVKLEVEGDEEDEDFVPAAEAGDSKLNEDDNVAIRDEALANKIDEVIRNNTAPIIKNEEVPKGDFKCKECNKEYKNYGCLANHERKVHGKTSQSESKEHEMGTDKPKRYRFKHYSCDICNKPFESKLLCLEHRTSHTGDKLFECEECGKGFGFLSSYKYHVRIHMRAKGMLTDNVNNSLYHFCEHCGKKFSDKHCLTNHINNQHLKKMQKLPCSICGVICQSRNQLLVHVNRKHRTDGRYQCITCGKRFGAKNTLDRHQLVHKEPQLECKYCGKKVKKMENLLNHERIHTGETPFKCPNCQLGFRSRPALCLHKRTHCKVQQEAAQPQRETLGI